VKFPRNLLPPPSPLQRSSTRADETNRTVVSTAREESVTDSDHPLSSIEGSDYASNAFESSHELSDDDYSDELVGDFGRDRLEANDDGVRERLTSQNVASAAMNRGLASTRDGDPKQGLVSSTSSPFP
jgi:hypothetical protein